MKEQEDWNGWEICQRNWDCKPCPLINCKKRKEMKANLKGELC